MMRRLEVEALRADLSSIDALLKQRSRADDPVGWFQFNQRKTEIEDRLSALLHATKQAAAVALFFGGRPVIGSKGILADFGARAVESFQSIVSTRFAALEGPLGERGPVPQRERSALMITEVARGSFGFVLEEADGSVSSELSVTSVKEVVDEVCDLIHKLALSGDEEDENSDGLPEALDKRLLGCLQGFFRLLDDSGATLRIVEDRREFSLLPEMIANAKHRTDALNVDERSESAEGRLFLLPEARRFELHPLGGGPTLKGSVAPDALASVTTPTGNISEGIIGSITKVSLRVRELKFQQREGRQSYQLLRIVPRESGAFSLSDED